MGHMPELAKLTYDDLWSFPDDGIRRELLDGELLVSPSSFTRHQDLAGRLYFEFTAHLRADGGGRVFIAPLDIILDVHNVFEPDVFFVADDRSEIVTDTHVFGVPTLVVEVLSNSRRDRVLKHEVYARFGVPEYWIVDGNADTVEIYRLGTEGAYLRPEILEPGDTLATPLPGLSLDVAELLRRD